MASVTCAREPVLLKFASVLLAASKLTAPASSKQDDSPCKSSSTRSLVPDRPQHERMHSYDHNCARAGTEHPARCTKPQPGRYSALRIQVHSSGQTTAAKESTSPGARGCAGPRQCTCEKPVLASCTASSHAPSPINGRCRFVGSNCGQAGSGLPREPTSSLQR